MSYWNTLAVERASELGFDLVSITPIEPPGHRDAFERWLDRGMHGAMTYMARHRDLRLDPARISPDCRSAIVVGLGYHPGHRESSDHPISCYAWGPDYHRVVKRLLLSLKGFLHEQLGCDMAHARAFVDTPPILERELALAGGLGWMGKNTCLIHPGLGSFWFVGELLIPHEVEPAGRSHPDRCGNCHACIDRCPTGALLPGRVLDSRRCISYLTIELKGPIPVELRALMGRHLFGCDLCQWVCPWNRKVHPANRLLFPPRDDLGELTPSFFLGLTAEQFLARFQGSPLSRAGRNAMARNAAVALGNAGDPLGIEPLVEALRRDPEALVRGHAAWALGRFESAVPHLALKSALATENDPHVISEIRQALEPTGPSSVNPLARLR